MKCENENEYLADWNICCRRRVEAYARCSQVTAKAVKQLAEVISRNLERLQEVSERCKVMTRLTETQLAYFNSSHAAALKAVETVAVTVGFAQALSDLTGPMTEMVREEEKRFQTLRRQVGELAPAIGQLHKRIVADHQLSRQDIYSKSCFSPC